MRLKNENGFTLIELMIVIVIIGIMAAIAVPSFLSWLPNMRLKAAARDLYSSMQEAKGAAVKTNTTVSLAFTAGCPGGSYTFTDGSGVNIVNNSISNGICLSSPTSFPNGFTPRGLSSGATGTILLTHPDSSRTYTITQSIAGNIKLQ